MRTIETIVYKFDELSDAAKERARDWYREFALDYEWWEFTYEDAERIGLKISEFDTYHGNIKGNLLKSVGEVCGLILQEHGKDTDTYKLAQTYYARKRTAHPYDVEDFTHDLLEEYLSMLRQEVDYQLSTECVDESIRANEYEFTESGKPS